MEVITLAASSFTVEPSPCSIHPRMSKIRIDRIFELCNAERIPASRAEIDEGAAQ